MDVRVHVNIIGKLKLLLNKRIGETKADNSQIKSCIVPDRLTIRV